MLKKIISTLLTLTILSSPLLAKQKLIIFHAGSLAIPFKQMEIAFEKKYPKVDVIREVSGSRTAARKISDLDRSCDIMASADYTVIEQLLIPDHANWNINFATNEMAIMYGSDSKYKDEMSKENWYEILLKDDVEYGRADPNSDPCGYRTLLVWQLAEKHYRQDNLYLKLVKGCPKKNIRPKETDLIALLEAGEIDYLFIYKSVAMQHKSLHIDLPVNINLRDSALNDFYKQAQVDITGKKPGEYITKKGQAMIYGITIPKNAPNKKMALKFVQFVLGDSGQEIMKVNGQAPINPVTTNQVANIPKKLRVYVNEEK